MAIGIQPILPSNTGLVEFLGAGINPNTLPKSGSPNAPDFQLILAKLLARQSSQFSILFGDDTTTEDATFSSLIPGFSPLTGGTSANSSIFGDILGGSLIANSTGGLSGLESSSIQLLTAASKVVGKKAEAIDPSTNQHFSGIVQSAKQQDGRILITIGEKTVPFESILSISVPD